METYFIATRVTPLPDNPLASKVEEAMVYFWIVEPAPEAAMDRATRYLASYKWKLESIEKDPSTVTAADFTDQEEGLKNWWRAKQKGFAAHFVGKPKDDIGPPAKP